MTSYRQICFQDGETEYYEKKEGAERKEHILK